MRDDLTLDMDNAARLNDTWQKTTTFVVQTKRLAFVFRQVANPCIWELLTCRLSAKIECRLQQRRQKKKKKKKNLFRCRLYEQNSFLKRQNVSRIFSSGFVFQLLFSIFLPPFGTIQSQSNSSSYDHHG